MKTAIERMKELINSLDFNGLAEALERIDNMEICDMIIERMFELDEEKALAYEANY